MTGDLAQLDQPCIRRFESTGAEIEVPQMRIEVDMQPFATRSPGILGRDPHELGRVPSTTMGRRYHRVEQEGMHAAIPRDVDKANKLARSACSHPAKTETIDLGPPVVIEKCMLEAFGMQHIHFAVFEGTTPFKIRPAKIGLVMRRLRHASLSLDAACRTTAYANLDLPVAV